MSAKVFPGTRCLPGVAYRALLAGRCPDPLGAPRPETRARTCPGPGIGLSTMWPNQTGKGFEDWRWCGTWNAMSISRRLEELFAKLDGFFDQAKLIYGDALTCHAGCDDCCKRRFSVTLIEAIALADAIEQLPIELRREIRDRALRDDTACPLLGTNGRCAAYEARPTICRTHGLPIRFPAENKRSLPMIDACPKNFTGMNLQDVDPKGVLDQATASTILAALDAAYADMAGTERGQRVEIVDLCREVCPDEPIADETGGA